MLADSILNRIPNGIENLIVKRLIGYRCCARPWPDRIIDHQPEIGDSTVNFKEVSEASVIAPPNDILRDCMAPSAHTFSNPGNGKFDGWQPQVYEVKTVTLALKLPEPRGKCPAGECGFKGKVATSACEIPNSVKHYAACGDRDGLGRKRG